MDENSRKIKQNKILSPKAQKLLPAILRSNSMEEKEKISPEARKKGFRKITTKRNEMDLERALHGHKNLKDLDNYYE